MTPRHKTSGKPPCNAEQWGMGFKGQRCGLDAGHYGPHVHFGSNFTIGWLNADDPAKAGSSGTSFARESKSTP